MFRYIFVAQFTSLQGFSDVLFKDRSSSSNMGEIVQVEIYRNTTLNSLQGGPLLVISRVITPINGLINR